MLPSQFMSKGSQRTPSRKSAHTAYRGSPVVSAGDDNAADVAIDGLTAAQ